MNMKRTLIAASAACVGAFSALADASVPYGDLKVETNGWFALTADGAIGGSVTSEVKFVSAADSKLAFENMGTPVVFTTTESLTQELVTVTLDVTASAIPWGKTPDIGSKIAVALYENEARTATNFVAWAGGTMKALSTDAPVPSEGEDYRLVVRFDNREGEGVRRKVKFAAVVGGVEYALKDGGEEWIDYSFDLGEKLNVGCLGRGELAGFDGVQLAIVAEVIPAGDGKITVREEDEKVIEEVIRNSTYKTVSEFMGAPASEAVPSGTGFAAGLTVSHAYALGLVKTAGTQVEAVNDGKLEVRAEAMKAREDGGISLGFVGGVEPREDCGATFSYQLWVSTDGVNYSKSANATDATSAAEVAIPSADVKAGYHFFKVKAFVTLGK